ncbi:MAG: hypothetical protein AAF564_05440 [Bacteroidota bacterium]
MNAKSLVQRSVALLLFLIVIGGAFYGTRMHQQAPEPTATPVTSVAWSTKRTDAISTLEMRLRKKPSDTQSSIQLAELYLQEAQRSLQEAYYLPKAQDVLDSILARDNDDFSALTLQASLYNTLHQFEKARDITRQLIARGNETGYIYGILVDALVELGAYEEAVVACDRMIALRPGISSYSRAAYLRELHGDGDGAIEAMKLAAEAGVTGEEDRSWALYQLGQLYLGNDDLASAEVIFNGILDETPYYAYALGGLAQVALQRGDLAAAQKGFEEAYAFVPADEFLEGLVEVQLALGDPEEVRALEGRLAQSYRDADAMGENVRMEYADFLVDIEKDLEHALQLAQLEQERRPNHMHALETYAWALHKNDRSAEAIPYIERAMRLGTGDAMVHFRAAHIYQGAGDPDMADLYFESALDANLHIESPSAAEEAKALLAG